MSEITEALTLIENQHIPAVICIVTRTSGSTPRKAGSKMIVFQDETIKGSIGGGGIEHQVIQEAVHLLSSGGGIQTKSFNLLDDLKMQCGGSMEVYFEPIVSPPRLCIFGGGHIGMALAGYASGLGFLVTVIDPREGIFNGWAQLNCQKRNEDYFQVADSLEFNKNTYLVIVTHQHEFDEKLLLYLINKEYEYLGMIGSKRKVAEMSKRALETGSISPELLSRVDMPIGIPFAAETPAEIAISIVAKLIDVKNILKKS
jgi:xanthine dehydrogenase accessory factor